MIIEDLIRLGRALLEGGMSPRDLLELIGGVHDARVKNFYRHVWVVEIAPEADGGDVAVLEMQVWGEEGLRKDSKTRDFEPDIIRALAASFVLPSGGNWLHPQGRYGVPVYPCFEPHLKAFRKSSDEVKRFLEGRLKRTPGFSVKEKTLDAIAEELHDTIRSATFDEKQKSRGVLILARCEAEAPYYYAEATSVNQDQRYSSLGTSRLFEGRLLIPDYQALADAFWVAKLEEGAEKGRRAGPCSITGEGDQAISPYCKAWPFAPLEWNCPLPEGGNEKLLVEGIGLSEDAYRCLVTGASAFQRLTRPVHREVLSEVFSPAADGVGRTQASRRSLTDLPTIYGAAILLPLAGNQEPLEEFVENVQSMLGRLTHNGGLADRHMDAVTGFDMIVPEGFESEQYRLTLVYYHGDPGRGDVHLRAYIEDVVPTTLGRLKNLSARMADRAIGLLRAALGRPSEKQIAYQHACYRSVPYLLARAYGGAYLWDRLEQCLRRRPLHVRRATANAARRMASFVPQLPESRFLLADEAVFYLVFLDFLNRYHQLVAADKGDFVMPMRPWKELYEVVVRQPADQFKVANAAELGFASGLVTAWFGRYYWRETGGPNGGKDFLKHRVLTFGTDLSPETLWKRGLSRMFDVAARYDKLSGRFRSEKEGALSRRVGVVLAEFDRLRDEVQRSRDEFMSAFWSGYSLYGYDVEKKPQHQTDHSQEAAPAAGGNT